MGSTPTYRVWSGRKARNLDFCDLPGDLTHALVEKPWGRMCWGEAKLPQITTEDRNPKEVPQTNARARA